MKIILGDSLEKLKDLPTSTIDCVVTDPPYGLGKEPDVRFVLSNWIESDFAPIKGKGFMGKEWDAFVPQPALWKEVYRVLKPGAHVLCFFGTRTYDWGVMSMRLAGFEVRDCVQWMYGSGFPKSLDVSKAIDKAAGAEREVVGPRKFADGSVTRKTQHAFTDRSRPETNIQTAPATDAAKKWQGFGTALKPANEPIVLARKPLEKGLTVAENVLKWGTGALNVDATRIAVGPEGKTTGGRGKSNGAVGFQPSKGFDINDGQGRWPANVLFDEWDEPVLTLQDSIPEAVKAVIEEYYADYCKVSDLRKEVSHISKPQGTQEVLQSGVLCEGAEQKSAGRESSDVRAQTHSQSSSQNAQDQAGARQVIPGQGASELQGLAFVEGLQARERGQSQAEGPGTGAQDDNQGAPQFAGASASNGPQTGPTAKAKRSRASQKRRQAGQLPEQPGATRHEPAQERTLASAQRGEKAPLLVRECDVPQVWARYFESAGFTIRARDSAAAMLDEQQSGVLKSGGRSGRRTQPKSKNTFGKFELRDESPSQASEGGASRFFYVAKASKRERNAGLEGMPEVLFAQSGGAQSAIARGETEYHTETQSGYDTIKKAKNFHPTVKPIRLMEYLCKLVCPPGGIVLDPFLGSGTTGCAAIKLGFQFIGIEREAEYIEIAKRRIAHWQEQVDEDDADQFAMDI